MGHCSLRFCALSPLYSKSISSDVTFCTFCSLAHLSPLALPLSARLISPSLFFVLLHFAYRSLGLLLPIPRRRRLLRLGNILYPFNVMRITTPSRAAGPVRTGRVLPPGTRPCRGSACGTSPHRRAALQGAGHTAPPPGARGRQLPSQRSPGHVPGPASPGPVRR